MALCGCGDKGPTDAGKTSHPDPDASKPPVQSEIDKKSPAEMSAYLYEQGTGILDDDVRAQLNVYAANWHNLCGESVALGIFPAVDEGASISDMAQKVADDLGLTAKDTVLVVIADSGDNYLGVGQDSILNEADITLSLAPGYDNLKTAILAKYMELNEFYMDNTAPVETEPPAGNGENNDGEQGESTSDEEIADAIMENFQTVMTDSGYIVIDVSDFNQEMYPDAKVIQAGNGFVTFYILQGSEEDTDNFWFFYYNKLLEFAPAGKFTQKYAPADLSQPKSVYGTTVEDTEDGEVSNYYRADCIGDVCIAASAPDDTYADQIDSLFAELGVPKNDNIVY